jgi:hypothetical protein
MYENALCKNLRGNIQYAGLPIQILSKYKNVFKPHRINMRMGWGTFMA